MIINGKSKVGKAEVYGSEMEDSEARNIYRSHAKWTTVGESRDVHSNFATAKAVASMLYDQWGTLKQPCEIRGNCTDSWVTLNNEIVWSYFGGMVPLDDAVEGANR